MLIDVYACVHKWVHKYVCRVYSYLIFALV